MTSACACSSDGAAPASGGVGGMQTSGGVGGGLPAGSGGALASGGIGGGGGVAGVSGAGGVGGSAGQAGQGATGGTSGGEGGSTAPDAGPPVDESAELYDEAMLPRFDITLPESSIAMLGEDPDTYAPGELRYGDEVVSQIGVRIKGEASQRTLEQKAAFKIKLDEFVPMQTFRGLRRMTFNNMVEDPSFLAERLAYVVFRAAGLPAPRCNSALVYVNDEFFGVYANIETEDKTFLRRWFDDEDGNLYEEGQVDFVAGAETMFDLETNELENDRSDLRQMIEVFEATDAAMFVADMDAVLDVQHFLRFTAAEALVNQWDMYGYTVFYPNNFRLYHDPTSSKFVFLPWGMDMSMKPFRDSDKAHIAVFELARGGDRQFSEVTAGALFQRCLESATCTSQYADAVRELLEVYEAAELEEKAMAYHAQIEAFVTMDTRKEYSLQQFEEGYESLLSTIRTRGDAIRADLMTQ
jgi:spore coat protein CotH